MTRNNPILLNVMLICMTLLPASISQAESENMRLKIKDDVLTQYVRALNLSGQSGAWKWHVQNPRIVATGGELRFRGRLVASRWAKIRPKPILTRTPKPPQRPTLIPMRRIQTKTILRSVDFDLPAEIYWQDHRFKMTLSQDEVAILNAQGQSLLTVDLAPLVAAELPWQSRLEFPDRTLHAHVSHTQVYVGAGYVRLNAKITF